MHINLDSVFGVHEQALLLRSRRAGILAANLANAETPNYKARDLDFSSILGQAGADLPVTRSNPGHVSAAGMTGDTVTLAYRVPTQPSIDGNTVDPRVEQGTFLKNAISYQASLEFLNGKIKGILQALRGD